MKIEPNSQSLFHINSCSSNKNFEDLEHLLKATNKTFDVIAIYQLRILKDLHFSKNINMYNQSFKFIPAESHAGGTLLYVKNKLPQKLRHDLCIYKSSESESTFIEIINKKQISSLVVYIDIQQQ